jgi:hypothetical protein
MRLDLISQLPNHPFLPILCPSPLSVAVFFALSFLFSSSLSL